MKWDITKEEEEVGNALSCAKTIRTGSSLMMAAIPALPEDVDIISKSDFGKGSCAALASRPRQAEEHRLVRHGSRRTRQSLPRHDGELASGVHQVQIALRLQARRNAFSVLGSAPG